MMAMIPPPQGWNNSLGLGVLWRAESHGDTHAPSPVYSPPFECGEDSDYNGYRSCDMLYGFILVGLT